MGPSTTVAPGPGRTAREGGASPAQILLALAILAVVAVVVAFALGRVL